MGATKAAPKIPAVTTLLQSNVVPVVTIACIPRLLLSPPCKNVPKQKPFRLSVSHEFNSGRLLATLKCLFKVNHRKDSMYSAKRPDTQNELDKAQEIHHLGQGRISKLNSDDLKDNIST